MNRRDVLIGASGLAAAAALGGCAKAKPAPSLAGLSGQQLMADVSSYVGFGIHRSGGAGDVATTEWMGAHLTKLGYAVEQPAFDMPNADTKAASIEIGGETFDGFAQPPIAFTAEGGLSAPLVAFDAAAPAKVKGAIAAVHAPRERGQGSPSPAYRAAVEAAGAAGAAGVLAYITGPAGEIVAINTPPDAKPTIPVLFVGEKDKAKIEAAAAHGGPARLRIEGPGGVRAARNTIGRLGKAGPWVVVSTPQSGWFTCGGERGPGIAMWRGLAEWAAGTDYPCRWVFIATSGHEWQDSGAHLFHHEGAPAPEETAMWLHLGASFGARGFEETDAGLKVLDTPNPVRSFMVSQDLQADARAAFAGQGQIGEPMLSDPATALGEIKLVIAEKYPTSAGFWGGHALFHTPIDGADATTAEVMAPIGASLVKLLEARLARL